jgi:hypothetical protein
MNIDRPGFEPLDPRLDREVIGAARFETDLGAGTFGVAFADDAEVSSTGGGVFSDLISDGDRGGVLAVGRFFFSDMPVEIIPSVGGCDQLASSIALQCPTARAHGKPEDPKIRRKCGRT